MSEAAILLGRMGRDYLTLPGEQHAALYAATRSGKTVSCAIPNCLTWPHSLVALDIKGELWDTTAGYRSQVLGQDCFLFDPLAADGRTACWNPLGSIDRSSGRHFDQIQRIAQNLFPESAGPAKFWDDAGRDAFCGVASYIVETQGRTSALPLDMPTVLTLFSAQQAGPYLREAIKRALAANRPFTRATVESLSDYLSGGVELINGVRKSVTTRLTMWRNPAVAAATATSDFDLAALRARPMSIYLKVSPGDIERLRPLLALFFQDLVAVSTQVTPRRDRTYRHPALLVLDEFPALGRMPVLADAFAFAAGYGLRMLIICQSRSQLVAAELYGRQTAENILENCGAEIVFGTKNEELARELSARIGNNTVDAISRNRPRWFPGFAWQKHTESIRQHQRALMLPQEIMRMDPRDEMIFRAGMVPLPAEKIRWYDDPFLRRRGALPPPEVPAIEVQVPLDDGGPGGPTVEIGGAQQQTRMRSVTAEAPQEALPDLIPPGR